MYKPKSLVIKGIISHINSSYTFRQGEAVVVVGSNLDDASQRGNGSGKSALIEAMALAFTGSSIRDVKTKELITNGSDNGEVELVLENTRTNKDLKIWRKIHAGTKAGECKIWLGKEEIKLPDILTYNKWIFDEIGLSKEDFFKFFLITSDNYEPFLNVGDTKKKEIINRFSGAETVDIVFPLIKEDVDRIELQKQDLEKQKITSQVKAQTLAQQVLDLEQDSSPEAKAPLIAEKRQKHNSLYIEVTNDSEIGRDQLQDEVDGAKKVVEDFAYEKQLEDIEEQLNSLKENKVTKEGEINQLKLQHSQVKDSFDSVVALIKKDETSINFNIQEQKKIIKDYEEFESELNKKLADSIECPKCSHKFSLRDKEFNVEEAQMALPDVVMQITLSKEQIEELDKQLQDIAVRKQKVNSDILAQQETIKIELQSKNQELLTIDNSISQLVRSKNSLKEKYEVLQRAVRQAEQDLSQLESGIELKHKQLELLEKEIALLEDDKETENKIQQINQKIEAELKVEEKLNNQLENIEKQIQATKAWEVNFKNFKSHVANQSIKNITDYTNLFLQSMGTNLSINIDGYKVLSSGKIKEQITTSVLRDGFDAGSYGKFSGGERGRIDIAVILAVQELINLNCKNGLDLLILDEILDQIDTLGLEMIVKSLQNLGKTVMMVSQNQINALDDWTILVEKKSGCSAIRDLLNEK